MLVLAGCAHGARVGQLRVRAVARWVLGRDGRSGVIGRFDGLHSAEASALHPDLVGKSLLEADVRARCNVHVVGVWERGSYRSAGPETLIRPGTVLILAGSMAQLVAYDDAYPSEPSPDRNSVV